MLTVIPYTAHIKEILDRHTRKVKLNNTTYDRLRQERQHVLDSLAEGVTAKTPDYILKTEEF